MRIDLACARCGKNRFNLDEDHNDRSRISCMACGHEIGTMLELKERVAEEVLKRAAARDAAKGGKTSRA